MARKDKDGKVTSEDSRKKDDNVAKPGIDESASRVTQPKDLLTQGVAVLSGLAELLKSPEATQQLVDSIVEKDEATGATSIKIPVESKKTVSNLLNLIGKLFSKE